MPALSPVFLGPYPLSMLAFSWNGTGAIIVYVMVTLGGVFVFLEYIRRAVRYLRGWRRSPAATVPIEPEPLAQLDARVVNRGNGQYSLEIQNTGQVDVEDVECLLPLDVPNWQLMIEVLPSYPIGVLEPHDALAIPLAVTMGGPAAIEVTLQGRRKNGVRYQRHRTLSVY
jgi:hypothetical protein